MAWSRELHLEVCGEVGGQEEALGIEVAFCGEASLHFYDDRNGLVGLCRFFLVRGGSD